MATQAQQPGQQMSYPLQGEMQLANWITNMFSSKVANPKYTGATVAPPQLVNQLTPQDLQNLMTEFMRGQGGFLQNMQQAKQSGLYNSNTQRLVANDLTAQAALKASQANVPIQQGNAQLMNKYYAEQAAVQPKYLPNQNKGDALGGLAIAGLTKLLQGGLGDILGGGKKSSGSGITKKKSEGVIDEAGAFGGAGNILEAAASEFLGNGLDANLIGETASSFGTGLNLGDIGSNFDLPSFDAGTALSGLNLEGAGSIISDAGSFLSNLELPDFDLDFDLPDFDFFDIGSWFD